MQNILQQQDDLKNFSQQQLIMEMQRPSGNVPQFLVLSELTRRKRMQDDFARAEAANAPTVAEEVVMAAGMGDMSQMAQAMAPKTSMTENTGIAAMMPRQPTRMATGGVVKMQTAGEVPFYGLERKVFKGQEYFTDGDTVYKQYESGQLDVVRDPDIVEGILGYSPSASTEVGSISSVLNADKPVGSMSNTIDPTIDRSAFSDPVLGIKPEMIAQLPDQGNPNFSSDKDTQKAVSEIAGTRGLTPTRDNYRPFLQNQPQVQELLLPTAQPTGRQSLDGSMVSTVGPTAAEIDRAQKVLEMNPVTASNEDIDLLGNRLSEAKGPLPYNELPGAPTRNETLLQDLITQNQALIPGANIPRQQTFLDNQPQDAEELLSTSSSSRRRRSDQDRDSSLATSVRSFIDNFINPPTRKEKIERGALELQEKSFDQPDPVEPPQQTFLDNQPQTTEELQKDLDKQDKTTFLDNQPQTREDMIESETAAVINSAANTLANDVGGDALGARGPEVAKAAQQGLDKRMWMRVAMYGLIASEGTAKSRADAAKAFLAMDAKDKALETKERIATADRASREKTTNARVDATLKSIEQRRASAAARNNIDALESIQEYLQGELLKVSNPLGGPKEGAINADAYNKINAELRRVVDDIAKIGGTSLTAYDADNLYQDNVDLG